VLHSESYSNRPAPYKQENQQNHQHKPFISHKNSIKPSKAVVTPPDGFQKVVSSNLTAPTIFFSVISSFYQDEQASCAT
jgi:hypothetical protein